MRVRLILSPRGTASGQGTRARGPGPGALVLSCLIHGAVVAGALLLDPGIEPRKSSPTVYDQLIKPEEKKLVWYRVRELPRIDPVQKIGDSPTPQGAEKRTDVILNVAPDAPPAKQLVLRRDDNKPLVKETPSPNLVAVEAQMQKQEARKTFKPPPAPATVQRTASIVAPPEPSVTPRAQPPPGADLLIKALPNMRKSFVPPPPVPTTAKVRRDLPDLPATPAETRAGNVNPVAGRLDSSLMNSVTRLPNRPFVAPAAGKPAVGHVAIAIPEPDAGSRGAISAAVVSTSPLKDLVAPLPDGFRRADLSAAPLVGPRASGNAGREGPNVPGLILQPGHPAAPPVNGAPVYEETRVAAMRSTVSAPLRPNSRTIPRSIEARFRGRTVYTMVIPVPKIPMYAGDWILWFAERTEAAGIGLQMRAPLPARKFGVVANRPEAKPVGRIQLSAIILRNGQLDSVDLLDKSTSGSKQAAIADFEQWQFSPALRDGAPVDVEIIIEIPYQ